MRAASLSESSTSRMRSSVAMTFATCRWRFVDHEPVEPQLFDDLDELLKLDRLADIAVHTEVVAGADVLFLFGRSENDNRIAPCTRVSSQKTQYLEPVQFGQF